MTRPGSHPSSPRETVEELMCGSDLPVREIAARTGVAYRTLCRWNREQGWRPPARGRWPERPEPRRRRAIARIHAVEGVDPGDLAEAIGLRRDEAAAFFEACIVSPDVGSGPAARAEGDVLRSALRAHVARQIAAFDAELTARGRVPRAGDGPKASEAADSAKIGDSAKVLRDLAGLKRILDDLDPPQAEAAAPEPPVDLSALRDRLARRIGTFAADRAEPRG